MSKNRAVARPLKKAEFEIRFATRDAEKGWRDALAGARNAVVDAWEFLTKHPHEQCERCYPLRGEIGLVNDPAGTVRTRWQYKLTDGGRIWFYVVPADTGAGGTVYLVRVTLGHPNETDPRKNFNS